MGYKGKVMINKYLILFVAIVLGDAAFGGVFKISRVGNPDVYVPTLESDATTLKVDAVFGDGAVPIGGMVSVMPSTDASAWQPPSSGVIKDGFMRADGVTIAASHRNAGCKLAVGTVLPNMVDRYPKGSATGGSTGGSNTMAGHYHSGGSGSTAATSLGITGGTASWTGSGSFARNSHVHNQYFDYVCADVRPGQGIEYKSTTVTKPSTPTYVETENETFAAGITNTPASKTGSNTVTGAYGLVTGGCDGNNSAGCNKEPANVTTVWVIRVK